MEKTFCRPRGSIQSSSCGPGLSTDNNRLSVAADGSVQCPRPSQSGVRRLSNVQWQGGQTFEKNDHGCPSGQEAGQQVSGQQASGQEALYQQATRRRASGREDLSKPRSIDAARILKEAVESAGTLRCTCTVKDPPALSEAEQDRIRAFCQDNARTMGGVNVQGSVRAYWGQSCTPDQVTAHRRSSSDSGGSARSYSLHGTCGPCIDPENFRLPSKVGILIRTNDPTLCMPGRTPGNPRSESKLSLRFAPTDQIRDMSTNETIPPSEADGVGDAEEDTTSLSSSTMLQDEDATDGTRCHGLVEGTSPTEETDCQKLSDLEADGRFCKVDPCAGYLRGPWPPPEEAQEEEEEEFSCEEDEEEEQEIPATAPCPPRPPCVASSYESGGSLDIPGGVRICVPCPPKRPPNLDFRTFPRVGSNKPNNARLHLGKPPPGQAKRICPLLSMCCPRQVGGPFVQGRVLRGKTPATCWALAANGLACNSTCDAYVMTYPPTPNWYKEFLHCLLPDVPAKGRCLVCAGPPPPAVMCTMAALADLRLIETPPTSPCYKKLSKKKKRGSEELDQEDSVTCDFGLPVSEPECEKPPYFEQFTYCNLETAPPVISEPKVGSRMGSRMGSRIGSRIGSTAAVGSKVATPRPVGSRIPSANAEPKSAVGSTQAVGSKVPSAVAIGSKVVSTQGIGSAQAVGSKVPSAQPLGSRLQSAQAVASQLAAGSSQPVGALQSQSSFQQQGVASSRQGSVQPVVSPQPVASASLTASAQVASAVPIASAQQVASAVPIASAQQVASAVPIASAQQVASAVPVASAQQVASAVPMASAQQVASAAPIASAQAVGSAQAVRSPGKSVEGSKQNLE